MADKYLCIHGHFYQPPRENPWLGIIEGQPSARPFHDWNERITRECYAPNLRARLLDEGRIARLVNNYQYMSFNFGPTLLAWMAEANPGVYKDILAADRIGAERNNGHGAALAQVYNHIIMPLANERDALTQIRWGLRDFQSRFGRKAEGMWLSETAANTETLKLLAMEGLKFTILAPDQAWKIRPMNNDPESGVPSSENDWEDVSGGRVDPRRPYRVFLNETKDLYIDVFFYDGPTSRAIAYEKLLASGSGFLSRIQQAFGGETQWPRLVNLATDGESYGHHFQFGDMALAWVFDQLEKDQSIKVVNYGYYLEMFPPTHEALIVENSSWSCAHGVERWRSNCGCHTGGEEGWSQQWRVHLREGLDWLRDRLIEIFEEKGGELFKDPWRARDDFISVLLDPSHDAREAFLIKHAAVKLDEKKKTEALSLMESQLMSLYMFTSCGWFFDDIAGLEPVQNMRYAARAIYLVKDWIKDLEEGLLSHLAQAQVNSDEFTDGADVYKRKALSAQIGPSRIVAHYAFRTLVEDAAEEKCFQAKSVRPLKHRRFSESGLTAFFGEAEIMDDRTGKKYIRSFMSLLYGGAGLACLVSAGAGLDIDAMSVDIKPALEEASSVRIIEACGRHLPNAQNFSLDDLIPDSRNSLVRKLAKGFFNGLREWVMDNYSAHREVLSLYRESGEPAPYIENFLFRTLISDRLTRLVSEESGPVDLEALSALGRQARDWGVSPDEPFLTTMVSTFLRTRFERLNRNTGRAEIDELVGLLRLIKKYSISQNMWESQNLFYDLYSNPRFREELSAELKAGYDLLGRELGFIPFDKP